MSSQDLPICVACATQYDMSPTGKPPDRCKICDDPRQFVPPLGQSWTSMRQLKSSHHNTWAQDPADSRIWSIWTEPKFGIGQRAFLLKTGSGNVLWDLVTLLDEETVVWIREQGGLGAIVVSHPHYYGAYLEWAREFGCKVYVSEQDEGWLCRRPSVHCFHEVLQFVRGAAPMSMEVMEGVTVIKAGGHFPGSLVLHWEYKLFIADTIVTVPSAHSPDPRPRGQTSCAFMWAIPNMIPLSPNAILDIWRAIKPFAFNTTYGAFVGMNVRDSALKERMLQSMKTQVRIGGWENHAIFDEYWL